MFEVKGKCLKRFYIIDCDCDYDYDYFLNMLIGKKVMRIDEFISCFKIILSYFD